MKEFSPWNVLGIEPTEDTKQIKKAYASALKRHPPEEDPEGFRRIRAAYERALLESELESDPTPVARRADELEKVEPIGTRSAEPATGVALMARVEALCEDPDSRRSVQAWKQLLDDDALWNLDDRTAFSWNLFGFVLERDGIPRSVLRVLEEEFQWTAELRNFYTFFDPDAVDRLASRLEEARRTEPAIALGTNEPIEGSGRSSGSLWWIVFAVFIVIRLISAVSTNEDRARGEALLQTFAEKRERARDEILRAAEEPERFRSMEWDTLRQAGAQNLPDAHFELGRRYHAGEGVAANPGLAAFWLRRAASSGHERAETLLANIASGDNGLVQ